MRVLFTLALVFGLLSGAPAALASGGNYTAHLSGAQEVPPRETRATGQIVVRTSDAGLQFRLTVANIENVRAAHIHCGAVGVNGPVGVTLFTGGGPGRSDGVLAQGAIAEPDAGNGCGWATIGDVEEAILNGGAYVNVHTNDGVDPPNTGAGDFPGGEIRGQLR